MRFIKRKVIGHYQTAHEAGRRHIYARPYIAPILGLLAGVAIVGGFLISHGDSARLRPSDSHVVFLSDNGQRQTLDTKAATVGDLVGKLPLHLIPEDVVEPSADTPIVQDNFRINVYRARPVTVVDGGVRAVAITAQRSPRVVAENAGMVVYAEDNVNFAPGSVQENIIGEKVVVDPATPVQFGLYGTNVTVRTHTKTVGDLLKEKKVNLTKDDTLSPAAETPITAGLAVSVIRNGTQVTTVEEAIDPPVQYINDAALSFGATALRQAGVAGKRAVTYEVVTQNGQVTSKKVISQVVVQAAVPKIVARGTIVDIAGNKTAVMAAVGISAGEYGYVDYIISHESNWNPYAQNGGSGACGLAQEYPCGKSGCSLGDAICQLRWANGYASSRYGGWYGAYNHWIAYRNW